MHISLEVITLPDGYNGHTKRFYAQPIERDGGTVKLQCAEPGMHYCIRWATVEQVELARKAQRAPTI